MLAFSFTLPQTTPHAASLDEQIYRIAQGEQAALAQLYHETHAAVYGFALSIVKHAQDAEDVLQDVYVQVYGAAGQYRSQGKPMAWLLTIARNLSLMRLREHSKTVPLLAQETQLPDTAAITHEDRLLLQTLLDTLGDEERQIVMLHSVTGLKHREIAAMLGLALPTVLSKYSRAIQKLRRTLKEED